MTRACIIAAVITAISALYVWGCWAYGVGYQVGVLDGYQDGARANLTVHLNPPEREPYPIGGPLWLRQAMAASR